MSDGIMWKSFCLFGKKNEVISTLSASAILLSEVIAIEDSPRSTWDKKLVDKPVISLNCLSV